MILDKFDIVLDKIDINKLNLKQSDTIGKCRCRKTIYLCNVEKHIIVELELC